VNKISITEKALMVVAVVKKLSAAYVLLKQASRERRWFGERRSIPNCCET
jgi:hypothetical protein